MEKPLTAKQTIVLSDDYKSVTITNKIGIKTARSVLQGFIKEKTSVKGYWSFYYESDDGENYLFTIDHPMFGMMKAGLL